MEIYFGGQIIKEKRGDLAAIITGKEDPDGIGVFLYPIGSDDYLHITSVRSVKHPIERAYIGINSETGDLIASKGDSLEKGEATFDEVDNLVIISHFLK